MALGLSFFFGVPLAWVLARVRFPGRSLSGLGHLAGRAPASGRGCGASLWIRTHGICGKGAGEHDRTHAAVHHRGRGDGRNFVFAMPFLVIAAEAGFRQIDGRYEEAAATLGADTFTRFRRVTVPLAAPSLVAGGASPGPEPWGSLVRAITFAGNLQGRTQTMPLAVYVGSNQSPPERSHCLSFSWPYRCSCSYCCEGGGSAELRHDASGRLSGRLDTLDLQADIAADAGEVVAVVGPNGAGNTTLLRSLAGLARMDDALVVVDGVVLDDSTSGVFVPTERWPIGFVFQDYLLSPAHLSAVDECRIRTAQSGPAPRTAWARGQIGLSEWISDRQPRQSPVPCRVDSAKRWRSPGPLPHTASPAAAR